jgi:FeS assembly SUF system protein
MIMSDQDKTMDEALFTPPEPGIAALSPGADKVAFSDDGFEPLSDEEIERLRRDIVAAIKTVFDPEIPVEIYELGLIYMVDIHNDHSVDVDMTLTSPGCPVAGEMPGWVVDAIAKVEGVKAVRVKLSFDPPWDMAMMSDEARFALNMF